MRTTEVQNLAPLELRSFIDHVPALGWSALPDGSVDYVNQGFRDYTGLSPDELYGSGWKSVVHQNDIQPLESWLQETRQSQEAGTTEVRLRRFDGSHRWFLAFANPLRDESGSIVAWYGTNIDIEDRKQTEATLRARELSWLQIVDNIPGLVATMGATGEVEFLNRQTLEYFGKSNEDLKNWALSDAVHPDDLPRIIQARIRSIEEGTTYDVEHRCRRADGVYRWFQVRGIPVRDAEDKITAWYLLLTDIDDRKRAEEALQSNERILGLIVNTMPAFAWSARPDGSVEFFNERWLNYTGLSAEEACDWGWTAAIHPDDLDRLTDYWRAILATGEAGESEARLRRFDGEYRWCLMRACALRDESGAIVKWYGTNTDIEDRKSAERELKRSEAFLAEGQNISQTGSFSWSVETNEIIWSEQLYHIFEFDKNLPVTLERITSRAHPDDLSSVQNMIERVRQAADDFEYEHRLLMPDQSVKHVHLFAHATRDVDGRLEYIGAVQDVTRRRVAEERLRERELNLRRITQTIPGMLWSATPQGEVDYCNRPWLDFTTMTAEQAKGWGWTAAIYPDDRDSLIEGWRSCLALGTPFDLEARMRRFDGAYRWFLFRANPLRDESGKIVKWYGTSTEIEDSKRREEVLRASELSWQQIVDNIPGLVAREGAMGEIEYNNRQTLEYFGKTNEELKDWSRIGIVHPDDLPHVVEDWKKSIETGQILDIEARLRRADGVYRWFQARGVPVRDAEGKISDWYVLLTDVDDRKRAEEKVRQSEQDLRTITETIPQPIVVLAPNGNTLYVNQRAFDITGYTRDQLDERGYWARVVHPDDVERLRAERQEKLLSGVPFELEFRVLYKSGQYRWILMQYNPLKDESGQVIRWYSTATDIDDRKRAEDKLRQSEAELRTITDTVRQPIVVLAPDGTTLYANQVALDNSGLTMDEVKRTGFAVRTCHPDDVDRVVDVRSTKLSKGIPFDTEMRMLFKDGQYRWQLLQYNPLKDERGQIIRWYVTATDIEDRKRAEQQLQQSEEYLRTITESIRQAIVVLGPDTRALYANRVALDYTNLTQEDVIDQGFFPRAYHPDDMERVRGERQERFLRGAPFDMELRVLHKSGQYRWNLVQYNPLKDDRGQIIRWYGTVTDIEDQKRKEERLRNENVVLREEIDRSSMFEEIVGSCKPMQKLLKQVEKVAPADSTVLILGETGTGKELIARALHRRSKRANRAFVKVNCAAIPQSLIASELFGHEKGAFTGALQRRVGRFEAANGGTLFLDEIGELPMETQIALLRVLQEKEFERVGSNHPVTVDVRLIAATNRDLPAAVADGTFRQDLFYRLNVFPIAVPTLHERVDDIPLLVEYFVGRFAEDAGKKIRHIGKQTLEQLKGYTWPGNIRELQNVVERAVVLCEGDTFVVDESWLKCEPAGSQNGLSALADREVEMIEAALADAHGRISGPSGAAAKLGIPRQTLESKIRRLGIDRYGQKRTASN